MSIGSFFKKLFGSDAGKSVEAFALTEVQKAIAALSKTTIGISVAADIKSLTSSTLTGAQKFEQVVANSTPLIASFLVTGGVATAVQDVEDVARGLVQSIFNDTISTKAGSIAASILKLLGL